MLLALLLASPLLSQEKRIYFDDDVTYAPPEARFRLTAEEMSDNLDYIEYSIDGGEMNRYESPIAIEEEGRHFITYRAVDITGNSSREKVYSVVIDATEPRLSASAVGEAYVDDDSILYFRSETAIILEAADALAGVAEIYVSSDNEEFSPYTGPRYFEDGGEQVGYAYATDNVGNRTPVYEARGVVDNRPPTVSVLPRNPFRTFGGERYSAPGNEILVRASDRRSGVARVEVSINDRPFQSYTGPVQLSESGFYSIRGRAVDNLGNVSNVQQISFYVGVDTPEPTVEPFID